MLAPRACWVLWSGALACCAVLARAKLKDAGARLEEAEAPAPAVAARYVPLMDRPESGRRILGGKRVSSETHPYALALLGADGRARCLGAAVGRQHVLTAAHCARVRLAFASRTAAHRTRDLMPVHAVYKHPDFYMKSEGKSGEESVTALHNDVAIVVVYNEFRSPVRLVPLGDALEDYLEYEVAATAGFGKVSESEAAAQLMETEVVLRRCPQTNWTGTVCGYTAWERALVAACPGDSGAPLLYEGLVVGVASLGPAACVAGEEDALVGAFTLVAPVREWLERTRRAPLARHEDERAVLHFGQVFKVMAADADRRRAHLVLAHFVLVFIYVAL